MGRHDEVAAVRERVAQARLVTVCGTGGIGKTRLAIEVARAMTGHQLGVVGPAKHDGAASVEGAWMVELAPVTDGELVPGAVHSELLGREYVKGKAADDLLELLRDRQTLLVLDNCEHVISGCVPLVNRLLRSCPQLRVLATSREPLHITGERVWWIQPLNVPNGDDVDGATLAASEAVELFVQRARDAVPGFSLDADTGPVVAEICRRLDGLPLAIELAAARAAVLSPEEILARLGDRFHLLTLGSASADDRHKTLRATLEWSHDLLSRAEAMVLRRLAVFAGGWCMEAAEVVCSGAGVPVEHVLDLTAALVAKSLVVADHAAGVTRYRMLETIRDFAVGKLDQAAEAEEILARHAAWCLARAVKAEAAREGAGHEAWLQRLEEDADNFRVALGWARDRKDATTGLRLANALTWFWQTCGHMREGLEWLEWALAASGETPSAERAKAMRSIGRILHTLGDHNNGLAMVDRGVALYRDVGQPNEARGCVCHDLFQMCRNPLHALSVLEENVARVRAMGEPNRLAHALSNLGLARFFRADAAGARTCFSEVVGLQASGIDGDAAEQALMGLARVALLCGRYDDVEHPLSQVLDHARRIGDADGQSAALSVLGELARARGDIQKARTLLAEALCLAQEAGAALSVGRCELFLGSVELADGALDSARCLYTQALRRVQAGATLAYHQVRCSLGLADVALACGDDEDAARFFEDAHDAAEVNGDDQALARCSEGRADLALRAGDVERALALRHQALDMEERIGELPAITRSLEALAVIASRRGRYDKAARLFGAASGMRERFGFARAPRLQASYEQEFERARGTMPLPAWERAWDLGRQLTSNEAIAFARKGRGQRRRPQTGWGSLTPAERDVVTLVVEGLTNPQVGERLFISRRTVGHHLAHVYSKLGIRSRAELTRQALSAPNA